MKKSHKTPNITTPTAARYLGSTPPSFSSLSGLECSAKSNLDGMEIAGLLKAPRFCSIGLNARVVTANRQRSRISCMMPTCACSNGPGTRVRTHPRPSYLEVDFAITVAHYTASNPYRNFRRNIHSQCSPLVLSQGIGCRETHNYHLSRRVVRGHSSSLQTAIQVPELNILPSCHFYFVMDV